MSCLRTWEPAAISLSYVSVKIFIVIPPCVYVLFLGFRQSRRAQNSTGHSDYFTFHMISVQMMAALSVMMYLLGFYVQNEELLIFGYYCNSITYTMEMLIHCFTCIDRYLAVIHPVTYLKLKKTNGRRLRNLAITCAWVISLGHIGVIQIYYPEFPVVFFISFLGVILVIICLCSLSVMLVLIRPGPSDVKRVDQSKRKAFNTISAIMGVLLFWLTGILTCVTLQNSPLLSDTKKCIVFISSQMFNIPQ
ncbi:hypothetical protein NL108_008814 [Boleophthalmus pectinirostris]|nr:hypothetical protein NL108_008814 [Boleophthalmus pectinirostris]